MLTEREIENKLKANFASLYPNDGSLRIVGVWDVAEKGDVKGLGDTTSSVLAVNVGIRSYASFCEPQADFNCVAVLSVRRDASPDGATLAEYIEPLMNLMHIWNADCDRMCDDLTTQTFQAGGFDLTGGDLVQNQDCWTITLNFTLRGIVNAESGTTTTIQRLMETKRNVIQKQN